MQTIGRRVGGRTSAPAAAPDPRMRLFVEARFAPCSETEFLAVRHGVEVVEADGNWRESFAADAWLAAGQGARVQLGHDGLDVGAVVCVVQRDGWHVADFVVEAGDPDVLRHVHVGRAVSIDARSVRRDDDDFVRIRRHRLAQLKAIAILNPGQHPGYEGAEITRIREVAQATTVEGEVLTGDGVLSRDCGVVLGVR